MTMFAQLLYRKIARKDTVAVQDIVLAKATGLKQVELVG